jgi:methionyl-tRNA formyltransferase
MKDVYNLIRGTNPQPGAWTTYKGKTIEIYDCAKVARAAGKPGQVASVGAKGFMVAAKGGQIQIVRVRLEGGQKISAGEFAQHSDLKKGDRLG